MMQNNSLVLSVVCFLLCLHFNYTFPLHRDADQNVIIDGHSIGSKKDDDYHTNILDRTKKMASNIESALRRIKDSTQDFGRNIYDHINPAAPKYSPLTNKNTFSEDDLREFEQMVIMKKYPYLDFKEVEKYSPGKSSRQSIKFHSGSNLGHDPSINEDLTDDIPNVEIVNRGLSGFAIPPELLKHVSMVEKIKLKESKNSEEPVKNFEKISKKSPETSMIEDLQNAIQEYYESKKERLS